MPHGAPFWFFLALLLLTLVLTLVLGHVLLVFSTILVQQRQLLDQGCVRCPDDGNFLVLVFVHRSDHTGHNAATIHQTINPTCGLRPPTLGHGHGIAPAERLQSLLESSILVPFGM